MINRFIMLCAWKLSKNKHSQLSQSPFSLTSFILHSCFKNSTSNWHLFTSRYTQTIETHIDRHKCLSFQANTMSLHTLSWAKRRTFTWGIDFKQNHNRRIFTLNTIIQLLWIAYAALKATCDSLDREAFWYLQNWGLPAKIADLKCDYIARPWTVCKLRTKHQTGLALTVESDRVIRWFHTFLRYQQTKLQSPQSIVACWVPLLGRRSLMM